MDVRGGHRVRLLGGGDELFPAMAQALTQARAEVWLATYIFNDDQAGRQVADALSAAASRGVQVRVLVDGFGSVSRLPALRRWFAGTGVQLEVFRPLDRWWAWLQPGQLHRMHHKLLSVDAQVAYVGGINVIDDRYDIHHGWSERARLDFAVELQGSVAGEVQHLAQALWTRASLARGWREELALLVRSPEPVARTAQLWRELRTRSRPGRDGLDGREARAGQEGREGREAAGWAHLPPVRAALVVRDNFRQRRAIERSYVEAIRRARERVDIACPYFYPGHAFRRALRRAAARGVRVRLLMQGKIDYRIAALAARVLYDEMLAHGIQVYEYTPAFLHAKVALVDRQWATVGSSNIDPLSLLLNLEANVVLLDEPFADSLAQRLEQAFSESTLITAPALRPGLRGWAVRGFVAWLANAYLRLAGAAGRY